VKIVLNNLFPSFGPHQLRLHPVHGHPQEDQGVVGEEAHGLEQDHEVWIQKQLFIFGG